MNLARLQRDTGRRDEARTMLAEIYNWYTGGRAASDGNCATARLSVPWE